MENFSTRYCDICLRTNILTKVRTICDECRQFYCKECWDIHKSQLSTRHHALIDLSPPIVEGLQQGTGGSNDDIENSSDFLEELRITRENTTLYRAQCAVEERPQAQKEETNKPSGRADADSDKVKTIKLRDFNTMAPEDKHNPWITGVLVLGDKIIISDFENTSLKLFNRDGLFLSAICSTHKVWGLTSVDKDRIATCANSDKKVRLWNLRENSISSAGISYNVAHPSEGIYHNGIYYSVLHNIHNTITILNSRGRQVRKIVLKKAFRRVIKIGWDIHMDSKTNNIHVPCEGKNSGILGMSIQGEALWFAPLSSDPWGITKIGNSLCVVGITKRCVYLVSMSGQCKGKLLDMDKMLGEPKKIFYDKTDKKLYITFLYMSAVSMFSVET